MKKILVAVTFLVSASAFALGGYAQIRGAYERMSGENGFGGGASIGITVAPMIGVEGYFDYTMFSDIDTNMMHFGGKVAVFPVEYLFIKAGAGIARTSVDLGIVSASTNDLELVGNVGVALPMGDAIAFTVEGQYRRIDGGNNYGGLAGVQFGF